MCSTKGSRQASAVSSPIRRLVEMEHGLTTSLNNAKAECLETCHNSQAAVLPEFSFVVKISFLNGSCRSKRCTPSRRRLICASADGQNKSPGPCRHPTVALAMAQWHGEQPRLVVLRFNSDASRTNVQDDERWVLVQEDWRAPKNHRCKFECAVAAHTRQPPSWATLAFAAHPMTYHNPPYVAFYS